MKTLDDVEPKDVKRIAQNIFVRLSKEQKRSLFGHVFWRDTLKEAAPPALVDNVRERLAKLGERFPPSLLAEVIYGVKTDTGAPAVNLLVETGFARDFVEANIIFDLVEWAVRVRDE